MVPLKEEKNVEVLREYAILATSEVERLRKELAEARKQNVETEWLSKDLRDKLHRLQEKFYGFGRESLNNEEAPRQVGHNDEQLKLHTERPHSEDAEIEKEKAKEPDIPQKFEYEMSEKDLEEESKAREISGCKKSWEKMKDFYQTSTEITITERTYTKVVHKQAKYRLKDEYNKTGKEVIITAPGPVKLKPGCQYSVDFALAVVMDKYGYHIPLERQRRKMEAAGLEIDTKTLFNLVQSVSDHHQGVVKKIQSDIMQDFCAPHLDETPWLIIGEDQKGQMWVMSNRIGAFYQFEPTRSGKIAVEMLKNYRGAVVSDAFGGYNRLEDVHGIRRALCWAHVRREFFERKADFKDCEEMIQMIDELFKIESKARSFDELRKLRKTESKMLIKKMQDWLLEKKTKYLPGDGITKAINYCNNNWKELLTFLTDLTVPLSNNDAERALRHAVLGRKNFTGSKTINGADVASTLYTVIESAKRVGLQPAEYMKYVITERWHNREPKSPLEVSLEKFGVNKRVQFPAKDQWEI